MPSTCYYQHRVDPEVPIEEVAGAVKDLIQQARSSTSGFPKPPQRRSAAHTPYSRSPRCKANTRSGTASPRRKCCRPLRSLESASFPISPLGKGFLTGKIDETTTIDSSDFRSTVPDLRRRTEGEQGTGGPACQDRAAEEGDARVKSRSPGCWRKSHGSFRSQARPSCIGSRKTSVRQLSNLRPDDLQEIEGAASKITVQGARYPEHIEQWSNR